MDLHRMKMLHGFIALTFTVALCSSSSITCNEYDKRFSRPGEDNEFYCRDICTKQFQHYEKVCLADQGVMDNCGAYVECMQGLETMKEKLETMKENMTEKLETMKEKLETTKENMKEKLKAAYIGLSLVIVTLLVIIGAIVWQLLKQRHLKNPHERNKLHNGLQPAPEDAVSLTSSA
ncbi:unnamed protein product [Owenia fusiformis]|uniref:Uncharacterized protein n=1 Tax=Owenia fusiformis TaxID=6347 RepID=A0A8J1U6Y0_OWEFU|nr:unnamed protein product [Owenia fusiformis]